MQSSRLSSKGQIVLRTARAWPAGTRFEVIDRADGVLLKPLAPAAPFAATQLKDVFRHGQRRRPAAQPGADGRSGAGRSSTPAVVIAADINVVVRLLVNDDAEQARRAQAHQASAFYSFDAAFRRKAARAMPGTTVRAP